jgi:hypothetical protein
VRLSQFTVLETFWTWKASTLAVQHAAETGVMRSYCSATAESEDVYCIKVPFTGEHCIPTCCRCCGDRMERLQGIARRCSLPPKLFTDSFIPAYLSRLPPDLEHKVCNHTQTVNADKSHPPCGLPQ